LRERLAPHARSTFTQTAVAGVLVAGVVACSADGPQRGDPPATTAPVATALAPSQVAGSTVAPPAAAPPCDVDQLDFAAAEESIVRIRNTGSVECEVDVSDSPNRDPLMEPSVWLRPGADAEIAVATDDSGCEQAAAVTRVDLVVNGEPVEAPVTLAAGCGVTLMAIYTAE
jgi:hypothetical protein